MIADQFKGISALEQKILFQIVSKIQLSKKDEDFLTNELENEVFAFEGGASPYEAVLMLANSIDEKDKQEIIESNESVYTIITWPEIQNLMEFDWFKSECYLINDDKGVEEFGSSAYFVPTNRITELEPNN